MTIELSVLDPGQVASPTMFEALVGEPAERLAIFSGIAIPEYHIDDSDDSDTTEIVVRLNYVVSVLDRAVVHVGLASIENDESNFLLAVDSGSVERDLATGELFLRVKAAILGDDTYLHRFSYQVVAHVRRVAARISGTIAVPKDILDLNTLLPEDVSALFLVTANRLEKVDAISGGLPWEKVIPVAIGVTGAMRDSQEACFVDYAIDGCPFNTPLRVDVGLAGRLALPGVVAGQVAGPRPVVLTGLAPDASGVDFAVNVLQGVR